MSSGHIGPETHVLFRSRSALYHIVVQVSTETWQVDETGKPFIEKACDFIHTLTEMWEVRNCSHQVAIVLFARVLYPGVDEHAEFTHAERATLKRNEDGVCYRDFYRVVVSGATHGRRLASLFRTRLAEFEGLVLDESHRSRFPSAVFSGACQGNVLEAMNLSLDALGRHYIDRSFTRTGLSLLVLSAGTGIFHVAQDTLALTGQRIADDGVGCDLVCLAPAGLHIAPLFRYRAQSPGSRAPFEYAVSSPFYIPSLCIINITLLSSLLLIMLCRLPFLTATILITNCEF